MPELPPLLQYVEQRTTPGRKVKLVDIVTFAESPEYLNKTLYPRQKTLLRLIYLDTENMTDYDRRVINEWASEFYVGEYREGVAPDIWSRIEWCRQNGYRHFREVEFIGGRRGGKGHIGAITAAYECWRMIQLGNPQEKYGIDQYKSMYLWVFATTLQQAKQYQFADISETINHAPCFEPYLSESNTEQKLFLKTPFDLRQIEENKAKGKKIDKEVASIRIYAQSSNSRASRGAATFALYFDEFAHTLTGTSGPQTGEEVYKASTPSLGQFGKDGFIYVPTSPYSKIGQAFVIYNNGLEINDAGGPKRPYILVIQLPSWGPYRDWDEPEALQAQDCPAFESAPMLPPEDDLLQAEDEEIDPDAFKVEKRAQWAEVINAYLNPKIVERMFAPLVFDENGKLLGSEGYFNHNHYPGQQALVECTGCEEEEQVASRLEVKEQNFGIIGFTYRSHADPSESGANFGFAIGHTQAYEEADGDVWSHVIIDKLMVWKPHQYPDHQLPYDDILEEIGDMIEKFPTMTIFTVDQFSALPTLSRLKRRFGTKLRLNKDVFTDTKNKERFERFKSALGLNWIHAYRDNFGTNGNSLLEEELKFLQTVNGKVVKQETGPVRTKDLADCFDDETEVLTENGWKLFADVIRGEKVATRSQEGHLEYQEPTNYIQKSMIGRLLVSETNRLNFAVTPTHRMLVEPVAHSRRTKPIFKMAQDIATPVSVPKTTLPVHGLYSDSFTLPQSQCKRKDKPASLPPVDMKDFAAFVGFWLAEGRKYRSGEGGYAVKIHQTKEASIKWFDVLLQRMNWDSAKYVTDKETTWTIKSAELRDYLESLRTTEGWKLPSDIWYWDSIVLEQLLEGLLVGDGTWSNHYSRYIRFDSSSKDLIDDVQRLLIHLGLSGRVTRYREIGTKTNLGTAKKVGWSVRIETPRHRNAYLSPDKIRERPYAGNVYCLTVPNGTLMVRRKGIPMWCGNCVLLLSSDLLKDQLDRKDNRLGLETPIRVGAQGGYHTSDGGQSGADYKGAPRTSPREILEQYGRGPGRGGYSKVR